MKNKNVEVYERLTKKSAEKAFEIGSKIYVLSADKDPTMVSVKPQIYKKYCEKKYINGDKRKIKSFNDILNHFSEWLCFKGYNGIPQRYEATHFCFSYWIEK